MMLKQLYMLADNLHMELKRVGKAVIGERPVSVAFGDLTLFGTQRVVSSFVHDAGASVIVEVFGDLGLLVSVEGTTVRCAVLDLARTGGRRGDGYLNKLKPMTADTAEAALGGAVKARFIRKGLAAWHPVEA